MDNRIFDDQKDFFANIKKIIANNMVSHAYFLEHNNYLYYRETLVEFCKMILENSVSKNNFHLINDSFDYPEIKVLEAKGKPIKKEQVLELKKMCSEKPVMGKYIIYIIDGAEFLNASSANTLLKFLEEPEDNIIGILVGNSRYQVINTLISRCQILSLNPVIDESIEHGDGIFDFVEKVKNRDDSLLIDIRKMYSWEKHDIIQFLSEIQNCCLKDGNDLINMRIIKIIEENKKKLEFNLNLKLFLDNLVIELIEVSVCTN